MPDPAQFDLTWAFDAELVEVPTAPEAMRAYVAALLADVSDIPEPAAREAARELVRKLGEIGAYARILGQHAMALAALDRSRALIAAWQLGDRTLAVHTLRHADVLRFLGRHDDADAAYLAVLGAPGAAEVHDFAWQHLGKLRLCQRRYAEAEACFERALGMRRARGATALVESSTLALALARSRPGG